MFFFLDYCYILFICYKAYNIVYIDNMVQDVQEV